MKRLGEAISQEKAGRAEGAGEGRAGYKRGERV